MVASSVEHPHSMRLPTCGTVKRQDGAGRVEVRLRSQVVSGTRDNMARVRVTPGCVRRPLPSTDEGLRLLDRDVDVRGGGEVGEVAGLAVGGGPRHGVGGGDGGVVGAGPLERVGAVRVLIVAAVGVPRRCLALADDGLGVDVGVAAGRFEDPGGLRRLGPNGGRDAGEAGAVLDGLEVGGPQPGREADELGIGDRRCAADRGLRGDHAGPSLLHQHVPDVHRRRRWSRWGRRRSGGRRRLRVAVLVDRPPRR